MKAVSLRIRMVLVFVALVAVSIGAMGTVSHFYARKILNQEALNKLIAVRNIKKAQIEDYFREKTDDIKGMADTVHMVKHEGLDTLSVIRDLKKSRIESYFQTALHELEAVSESLDTTRLFGKLKDYYDATGVKPDGPYDVTTASYDAIYTEHGKIMYRLLAAVGFSELYMICTTHGHVMFQAPKGRELGTNIRHGPFKDGVLRKLVDRVIQTNGSTLMDIDPHALGAGEPAILAGTLIRDEHGIAIAVLAAAIPIDRISEQMHNDSSVGVAEDIYLVGPDKLMRSDCLLDQKERSVRVSVAGSIEQNGVDTVASREALSGKTGADVIENCTGDLALSAYAPVDLPGMRWAIMAERNITAALSLSGSGSEADFFKAYTDRHGHPDILLISQDGHVPYTVGKRADYRTNLLTGEYSRSNLGGLVRRILDSRNGGMSDVELYDPGGHEPALFMAQPLLDRDHIDLIVAVRLSLDEINKILHEREGMGSTYESYLVGPDKRMRSDSILDPQGHALRASFENTVEKSGVDTEASCEALQGKSGAKAITDYRGVPVLSAYAPLDIDGVHWALISEVDLSEVEAPAVSLRNWSVLTGFSVMLIMAVLVCAFSTSLSGPIVELTRNAKTLADGNLDQEPAMRRTDEIGELSRSLGSMVVSWRSIVRKIMESATRLSSTSAVITVAAEEMSRGAESQLGLVLRTSSAMEEMSRSIQEVSDNARGTLETAIGASNHAREGSEKVRKTVEGFNQADASIRRLNHRVQKIGRVVQLIGEIAAQTNILAFNAAIEAARAGEHGRGFDVVAEEIRKLAQRTTNSTAEITATIEEIQAETRDVVQIMETGAVEVGAARQSLEDIVNGIVSTTDMVQMIASTAAQQAKTAAEIADALQNISDVSTQTAQGSRESAKATQELTSLADQLKEITGQFKA